MGAAKVGRSRGGATDVLFNVLAAIKSDRM